MKAATEEHAEDEARSRWDGSVFLRLARFARPHWKSFAASLAVLATVFLLELLLPRILRGAIDESVEALAVRAEAPDAFDPSPYASALWRAAGAYLAVVLVLALVRYFEVAQITRTGQLVVHDLRTRLFGHVQRLDVAWFDRRSTGALVTRVTNDIENLNEAFTSGLIVLGFDLVKIAGLLGALFWLEWRLALLVVGLTPLLIVISMIFRGGAREAHRIVRRRLAEMNGYLQEALSGIRVVQVFRREERVSNRFGAHLARYLQANIRTILLFALFFPAIDFVVTAIQGSSVWMGGGLIASGRLSYGEFLQFWWYLTLLVDPIRELGERYNVLLSAFASADRIFGILDTKAEVRPPARAPGAPGSSGASSLVPLRGHVRFENVSFAYAPGVEVATDISFEIEPGQTVAIVGATGAGKSTLASLLLRFYDPTRGRVTIDGVDLRELDLGVLRRSLGIVLQEDFLFTGTVRENLSLERPEATDEAIDEALSASHAADVVARLPAGLESPVAERGATLSTGERELLAFARALAARPKIVVLDEATSSVDSNTEARIERATRRLLEGRTALVIAHRLSTVRRADKILVMHRGRIREQGRHEELLARGGIYARLHAMQFQGDGDGRPARAEPVAETAQRSA